MNSINDRFNGVRNSIAEVVSTENNILINTIQKTVEIGKDVIVDISPHLINISSYELFRRTNLRMFSILGLLAGAGMQLKPHDKWLDTAVSGVIMTTNIMGWLDLAGFIPVEKEYRVAIDCLFLLANVIGSGRAIYEGTNRMVSSWNGKERKTTSKISDFISGAFLTTIGAISFGNSLNQTVSWISGVKKLQHLDSEQLKAVFKHRAIPEQAKNFECTAVIIDGFGMNRNAGEAASFPFAEELYRNCNTRSYTVNSDDQFCAVLKNARDAFGDSISILSLQSHANNQGQDLGDDYFFTGNQKEVMCMKENLSSDAQIALLGCNTATITPDVQTTLLDKISKALLGKTVTGFNGFYQRWYTTTSWLKDRFSHENYLLFNTDGIIFSKTAVEKTML